MTTICLPQAKVPSACAELELPEQAHAIDVHVIIRLQQTTGSRRGAGLGMPGFTSLQNFCLSLWQLRMRRYDSRTSSAFSTSCLNSSS